MDSNDLTSGREDDSLRCYIMRLVVALQQEWPMETYQTLMVGAAMSAGPALTHLLTRSNAVDSFRSRSLVARILIKSRWDSCISSLCLRTVSYEMWSRILTTSRQWRALLLRCNSQTNGVLRSETSTSRSLFPRAEWSRHSIGQQRVIVVIPRSGRDKRPCSVRLHSTALTSREGIRGVLLRSLGIRTELERVDK